MSLSRVGIMPFTTSVAALSIGVAFACMMHKAVFRRRIQQAEPLLA
jgi:hypothetical protein